jgi:hypothetical protein
MARWGDRRRRGHETQVLLLGTGNRAQRIAAQIESSPRRALRVIGFLDDDPSEEDRRKLAARYLGRLDQLGGVAAREGGTLEAVVHHGLERASQPGPGCPQPEPGPQGELGVPGVPYVPLLAEPDMSALM